MTRQVNEAAALRKCLKSWLVQKPDGYEFTVRSARKALGLEGSREQVKMALQAYVGHLVTNVAGDDAAGNCYRMLPKKERTKQIDLPR